MKTVTFQTTLPCSAQTFWQVFLDLDYTRRLYLDGLQFHEFQVLGATEATRRLHLAPKLPAGVHKLVGDSFAYEDHGTLDRARNLWTWKMVPRKEIVATRGTMRIEPVSETACRRQDEVVIEGKLFGVGGVLEAVTEKEVRASFAQERVFFTDWLATRR